MGINANVKDLIENLSSNDIVKAKRCALAVLANDKAAGNERWRNSMKQRLLNQDVGFIQAEIPYDVRTLVVVEDVSETFIPERFFVSSDCEEIINRVATMHRAKDFMNEHRISYLNSTLLYGASGTGKTMFARYIAHTFNLPFIYLNFSRIVDSYLGKTSSNLASVFQFIHTFPCVFMMDEMDCISLERKGNGSGAGGEMDRVTITLLQELDRLANDVILIGATNRVDRVDSAVLRRFQFKRELKFFDRSNLEKMICQYVEDVGVPFDAGSVSSYLNTIDVGDVSQATVISYVNQKLADAFISDAFPLSLTPHSSFDDSSSFSN